uniref:Uncharacterized protein n=1 Tax=Physcomitrium patens TaxID=3218 RepID=A0A7I3Z5T0_PHYPA
MHHQCCELLVAITASSVLVVCCFLQLRFSNTELDPPLHRLTLQGCRVSPCIPSGKSFDEQGFQLRCVILHFSGLQAFHRNIVCARGGVVFLCCGGVIAKLPSNDKRREKE